MDCLLPDKYFTRSLSVEFKYIELSIALLINDRLLTACKNKKHLVLDNLKTKMLV